MRPFRRQRKAEGAPGYWNTAVVERIERDGGVDRDTAALWFREMLVFLDLAAASREAISPPKPVDVAWHAFILHTRDYESYCRGRFGRVIHHEPAGAPDPEAYRRAYARRSSYGGGDNTVWAAPVGVGGPDPDGDRSPGSSGEGTTPPHSGGSEAAGSDPGGADGGAGSSCSSSCGSGCSSSS